MPNVETLAQLLEPITKSQRVCVHPFMLRFAQGELSAEQIRWWARKILPGSNRFNQSFLLAAAMTPDVQDRILLIDNIYTEHGCLDLEKAHVPLFINFMKAIGCQNISVNEDNKSDAEAALTFKRFAVDINEPLVGVLSRFLAIETLLPQLVPMYVSGIRKVFSDITDKDLEYFHVHSILDPEHQKDLLTVIARNIKNDEDINIVMKNYSLLFQQTIEMFDYMLSRIDLNPWQFEKELIAANL